MKNLISTLSALVIITFLFTSCGGGAGKTVNNDLLGEYPSMVKNYEQKIDDLEKDAKSNTDLNKAFELAKKIENLKDEYKAKLKEYADGFKFEKPIPFEPLTGTKYTVTEIKVKDATPTYLGFDFSSTINDDIKNEYNNYEQTFFVYFKALDAEGKDIPGAITVAASSPMTDLKKGTQIHLTGGWRPGVTKNFENFAKIKEITKEEYDQKK